jgi:hypothetical protein
LGHLVIFKTRIILPFMPITYHSLKTIDVKLS